MTDPKRMTEPKAAETVRGWRKTSSDWPYVTYDERTYFVQFGDSTDTKWAECRKHVETAKAYAARGRPLTLREVVDIVDPDH